jgi:hypothetical protein
MTPSRRTILIVAGLAGGVSWLLREAKRNG